MRNLSVCVLALSLASAGAAGAQGFEHTTLMRALALEDSAKWNDAIAAYRQALAETSSIEAVFGLERVYAVVGRSEVMIQLLDSLITRSPRVQSLRVMQLRTFRLLNDPGSARLYAEQWMRELPDDPEAYRQVFAHASLTPALAREIARNIDRAPPSDSIAVIQDEFAARLAAAELWPLARTRLEREYARAPTPALAARLAVAYVRSGDLERARAFARSASAEEDPEVRGWLSFYAGDFTGARVLLTTMEASSASGTAALSYLARTRAGSLPAAGAGFLALARGDSAGAISGFIRAADVDTTASSLLLAMAARLSADNGQHDRASELWATISAKFAASPEAPEALLQRARHMIRSGRRGEAIEILERMILEHSGSALIAQARRELDLARNSLPPRQ